MTSKLRNKLSWLQIILRLFDGIQPLLRQKALFRTIPYWILNSYFSAFMRIKRSVPLLSGELYHLPMD